MKNALDSFIHKRPWLSFLFSVLSLFVLICGFFFFGTYVDSAMKSWWLALLLFLLLLVLSAPAFAYQVLFYMSTPKLSVGRFEFGRGFLLLVGIMLSCLLTFLVDLPFYLVNLYSWPANGSFGPLGLDFAVIALVSLSCVGGGMGGTFGLRTESNTTVSSSTEKSFAQKVNAFMPYFLASYFLLIVLPYSFALVPVINAFFTGLFTKIAFRAFTCLYFLSYSFLLMKANRSRVNMPWLVILSLLICFYLIAWITVPTSYSYYTTTFERGFTFHWIELGQLYIFISLATFVLECIVFLCLISFFPGAIKSRKSVIIPLLVVVLFALFGCFFSYIKEGSSYLSILKGLEVDKNAIHSIYHSKNAFGIFLFLGCFSTLFLAWYVRKQKWIFFIVSLVFVITAGVVKCYTAFIPALVMVIALLIVLLFKLRKNHRILFVSFCSILCVGVVVLFVMIYTPAVRDHSKILTSLYLNLQSIGTGEVLSRTKLWDYCLSLIRGPFVLIGETDVVATDQLTMIEQMSNDATFNDFHSAFVSFYSGYGLAGLIVYLGIHAYALKGIHFVRKRNSDLWLAILVLFFGAVLFSMPETYTLFVNMSAAVFPINLVLLVFPRFLSTDSAKTGSPDSPKEVKRYETK